MKTFKFAGIILLSVLLFSCSNYSRGRLWGGNYLFRSASMPENGIYEEIYEIEEEVFDPSNFDQIKDNPFRLVNDYPLSTFSIDVDTAGYTITRRYIERNQLPPTSAIRIEELINYFDYDYAPPKDDKPFAVHTEVAPAPWNPDRLLARIAIKGKEFPAALRPRVNLVFLIDVSGSMDSPTRLPLVIESLKLLVNELNAADKIAICVYASAAGVVLPPTDCGDKEKIISALQKLKAGGSTAGGQGIQQAYSLAQENFLPDAVNRVIICTDGDFNVGITNRGDLSALITEKAKTGVYLTVLGFGMDNFQDGTLKQLSSKGNGNYGYIDTIEEAQKILVKQLSGTLITIANDVKIQVDFNPANAGAYRLIGYENRLLRDEEFNDDSADAGDIGAGHTVTAFYEIIKPDDPFLNTLPRRDPSKYGPLVHEGYISQYANELMSVKIRYKLTPHTESELINFPVQISSIRKAGEESLDFRFASSVAGFGMLLRDSSHKGNASYASIINLAQGSIGNDLWNFRRNFVEMVKKASVINR
ncbi:MAG: VWA domain-containing protein [Treponema sp.]|nr:VWA domain-containing protein [Treponema sp.]